MPAYEIVAGWHNESESIPQDRKFWVIGDATSVALAITGLNADAQRLPAWADGELHPSHPDVHFTLPRDHHRLRAALSPRTLGA